MRSPATSRRKLLPIAFLALLVHQGTAVADESTALENSRAAAVAQLIKAARASGANLDASEAVLGALTAEEPQEMLVELVARAPIPGNPHQVHEHASKKDALLTEVAGQGITAIGNYAHLPMMFLRVPNSNALLGLLRNPNVKAVYENYRLQPFTAQSLSLINQPAAAGAGYTGAGTTVAIVDTGLDYTKAAFGPCSAPNAPANTCKVSDSFDIANDGSRQSDTYDSQLDDPALPHGTNVSGIVGAVAPGAKLIGIDVFDGSTAPFSRILGAFEWVQTHYDDNPAAPIRAMNLSLGDSSHYTTRCNSGLHTAIANVVALNVAVAVAAGNDAYVSNGFGYAFTDGVSWPACEDGAIAVGAVYDAAFASEAWSTCTDTNPPADRVTCFSQTAPFLDLLAPGAEITAAEIPMSGTSQATPHVAGAAAVVAQAHPTYTPAQIVSELQGAGVEITDPRTNRKTRRINLAYLGSGEPPPPPPKYPDLLITGLTASATPVNAYVSYSATVQNQGQASAGASVLRFYFSIDQNIDPADDAPLWVSCSIPVLPVNASHTCSGDAVYPGIPNGVYYVGAVIDQTNAVAESNEANNTRTAPTVTAINSSDGFPTGGELPANWISPASSDKPWSTAYDATYAGASSLKSGAITHSQKSDLSYTATFSAGTLSFALKVSSESGFDRLEFYVDGILNDSWSGEQDWLTFGTSISAGTHNLLWRYVKNSTNSSGSDAAWIDSVTLPSSVPIPLGDFNTDGKADLLWHNTSTGQTAGWLMNGLTLSSGAILLNNPAWKVVGVGDLNGDGKADILWNNATTGQTSAWLMNGLTMSSGAVLLTNTAWKPVAMGDLNGDGKADILWSNATTGQASAWLMNGLTMSSGAILLTNTAWKALAMGDLNGDGKADILWNNATTGQTSAWLMNGLTRSNAAVLLTNTAWKPTGMGDLNGDRKADIVWNNTSSGQTSAWLMNGLTISNAGVLLNNAAWKPAGLRDLNGDGKADLLWHNATTGQTSAWLMNGLSMTSGAQLLSSSSWEPVAP